MAKTPQSKPGSKPTKDLTAVKKWWKALSSADFVALAPPDSGRMTTGEGHEDATEALVESGQPMTTPYAFWQWQSHKAAFNAKGELIDDLLIHYSGDIAAIATALASPPEPFTLVTPEPGMAFRLTKDYPLGDAAKVRDRDATMNRLRPARVHRSLTQQEIDWLREAVEYGDRNALAMLVADKSATLDDLNAIYDDVDLVEDPEDAGDWIPVLQAIGSPALDDALAAAASCPPDSAAYAVGLGARGDDDSLRELTELASGENGDAVESLVFRMLREGADPVAAADRVLEVAGEPALSRIVFAWAEHVAGDGAMSARDEGMLLLLSDKSIAQRWHDEILRAATYFSGIDASRLAPYAAEATVNVTGYRPLLIDYGFEAPAPLQPSDICDLRRATNVMWPWQQAAHPTVARTDLDVTRARFERAFADTDAAYAEQWYFWMPDDEAAAFSDGQLEGALPVYWGPDRTAVAAHLRSVLPDRFVVSEPAGEAAPIEITAGPASYAAIVTALRDGVAARGETTKPARQEGVDYLEATVCRYAVRDRGHERGPSSNERFLFDLWRSVDGSSLPDGGSPADGDVRFLSVAEATAVINEVYTEPDGAAVTWNNGWPFMPFARLANSEYVWADHRVDPPTVVRGTADGDKVEIAPSVRAWLSETLGLVRP